MPYTTFELIAGSLKNLFAIMSTVESKRGQGTTFTMYLPQVADTGEEGVPTEGAEVLRGNDCILFVDDEEPLVRLAQESLIRFGYEVIACTSSVDALEAFRAAPERFDLVITDQTMPHLTGEKLVRELRRIRPDIAIILCTGFSHTMDETKATALGVDAFCLKPLVPHDLGLVVQAVLRNRGGLETGSCMAM